MGLRHKAPYFTLAAVLGIVLHLGWPSPASAASCSGRSEPAAPLLFPYFEVDLSAGDPSQKATTLISIGNATAEPTLTRVVLWTDLGLPTASFSVYLQANGVQSLNLASILRQGSVPSSGPSGGDAVFSFPSCSFPITPTVTDLAALQAQHTGRPHPGNGLCYGFPRPEDSRAVGFVTVDVVKDCSNLLRNPTDFGYFAADGNGLAIDDNRLYGDFFLIDPANDLATGQEAMTLIADRTRFGNQIGDIRSFYSRFSIAIDDHRAPLGESYRLRFLQEGPFDAKTELLLWMGGTSLEGPRACDMAVLENRTFFVMDAYDQDGRDLLPDSSVFFEPLRRVARVHLADLVDLDTDFGSLEVESIFFDAFPGIPAQGPVQSWVMPLVQARDRFSVGMTVSETGSRCQ